MLTRRCIRPFARGAAASLGSVQADVQASVGRVIDASHQPVAALAVAVRKIMTADGLGIPGETSNARGLFHLNRYHCANWWILISGWPVASEFGGHHADNTAAQTSRHIRLTGL